MIDVHVPHKSEHTWTDFFIHIGTIAVGLLLAIALEQGVEWLHHRHERDELIVAMRSEAQNNRPVFERSIARGIETLALEQGLIAALKEATVQNGMVDATLPPHQAIQPAPNAARATWTIARTNGKAALLPDDIAETYNRLDYEAELHEQASAATISADLTLQATKMRLGIYVNLDQVNRLNLSVADRDALAQSLAQFAAAWSMELSRYGYWRGANDAVADGVESWQGMRPYMVRSLEALQQAEAQAGVLGTANASTSRGGPGRPPAIDTCCGTHISKSRCGAPGRFRSLDFWLKRG